MASESVRYSDLINQIVLNRSTMDELGRVEVLWEYPQAHRVLGFICKSGAFDRTKTAFNLDQLDTIGENGIFVNSAPVETDADRVRQIESLVGSEVWTDMGSRLGRINDHVFELKTGMVKVYLFSPGGLRRLAGPVYALYPTQVLGWGSRRVVVSAGIADQLEIYEPGVQDKISRLAETFNEETAQAGQGLQSVMERAKNKAKRAKSKAQILAEQAKERAQELSYELLETTEVARDRARDLRDEFLEDGGYYEDDRRDPYHRGRMDDYDDDDFDFDAPWDQSSEAAPRSDAPRSAPPRQSPPVPRPQRRSEPVQRAPLNLEPKSTSAPRSSERPPSPYATRPRDAAPPTDQDPWDDDWD
ncbi:PRC-barrel domain-containing protein [filamentous cyanobacterium LEGE 11480]|uniref:PRC-barrel domain-containing protein n=1 Tax=Romeriopsis navalis LEGE 11480 TaxID=2777977 RepID=A0A928Z4X4_9CYAN|nr:PRC-barrel domain-containing protein [Romeriopsis navalis]MBE9030858.1 PRC-barrel domain-containing protein [Romeriopsis navalis LEGE 11480]